VWLCTLTSNVGSWMQNVALGALVWSLWASPTTTAVAGFAILGPALVLAPVGGALADRFDRRRVLLLVTAEQLVFSVGLAIVASLPDPPLTLLLGCVLALGIGNAIGNPVLSALLPSLVPPSEISSAVALQSVQMNLSRVLGPAVGGLLIPSIGTPGVFAFNAATYLFAVGGLLAVRSPLRTPGSMTGLRAFLVGFAVVRTDPLVRTVIVTVSTISLFAIPFAGLMPVLAAENLGLDVQGLAYGFLYACFAGGAALGAVAVGTVFVVHHRGHMVRWGLVAFSVLLLALSPVREPTLAYPVMVALGFAYFWTVTSLATRLQEHLDDSIRGRVMSLYTMAFVGMAPVGFLLAGQVTERTSFSVVLVEGAAAMALAAGLLRPARLAPGIPPLGALSPGAGR
jgi:MFS family permease